MQRLQLQHQEHNEQQQHHHYHHQPQLQKHDCQEQRQQHRDYQQQQHEEEQRQKQNHYHQQQERQHKRQQHGRQLDNYEDENMISLPSRDGLATQQPPLPHDLYYSQRGVAAEPPLRWDQGTVLKTSRHEVVCPHRKISYHNQDPCSAQYSQKMPSQFPDPHTARDSPKKPNEATTPAKKSSWNAAASVDGSVAKGQNQRVGSDAAAYVDAYDAKCHHQRVARDADGCVDGSATKGHKHRAASTGDTDNNHQSVPSTNNQQGVLSANNHQHVPFTTNHQSGPSNSSKPSDGVTMLGASQNVIDSSGDSWRAHPTKKHNAPTTPRDNRHQDEQTAPVTSLCHVNKALAVKQGAGAAEPTASPRRRGAKARAPKRRAKTGPRHTGAGKKR